MKKLLISFSCAMMLFSARAVFAFSDADLEQYKKGGSVIELPQQEPEKTKKKGVSAPVKKERCRAAESEITVQLGTVREGGRYTYYSDGVAHNASSCLVTSLHLRFSSLLKGKAEDDITFVVNDIPPGGSKDFTVTVPAYGYRSYKYSAGDIVLRLKRVENIYSDWP